MATGPGGLDLAALASGAAAETDQRNAGGTSLIAAALASMLAEQRGMLGAKAEEQGRAQAFSRAQALLDEQLAQRQASLAQSARDAEPNWYEQQDYALQQDLQKATFLAELQNKYDVEQGARDAAADTPSLSEFGAEAIHPVRGQLLAKDRRYSVSDADRKYAREQLLKNPEFRANPDAFGADLYDYLSKAYKGQSAREAGGGFQLRGLFGAKGPKIGGHGARKGRPDTSQYADERASILLNELLGGTINYG